MSSEKNYAKYCAKLGNPSKGWFLGLKLHVVINEIGEIQGIKLTPGNGVPASSITKTPHWLVVWGYRVHKKEAL
ncbi:hypothetical protein MIDIC_500021 [Alphaproteobacteria bacterium]